MGPAELIEGDFAGVNADAYDDVAAGEAQTFDPIMRGLSGETERWRYRNVGRLGKRILLTCCSSFLVLAWLTLSQFSFWEWSSFGLRPKVRESPLSLAVAGD